MIEITNDAKTAPKGVTFFWAERQSVAVVYLSEDNVKILPLSDGSNTHIGAVREINKWLMRTPTKKNAKVKNA